MVVMVCIGQMVHHVRGEYRMPSISPIIVDENITEYTLYPKCSSGAITSNFSSCGILIGSGKTIINLICSIGCILPKDTIMVDIVIKNRLIPKYVSTAFFILPWVSHLGSFL